MLRTLLLRLAYSNVWLAGSAAAQAYTNCVLMRREPTFEALALPVASLYLVYTFAKTVRFDPQADAVNDPERTAFLLRWRRPLIASAALAYAWGMAAALRHGLDVAALFVFPVAIAVLYDVKVLPEGWRYRRLKDLTGVKSLVVAVTWAVAGVLLPARLVGGDDTAVLAILTLWNSLVFFVNTVYFDMGDVKGDRLEGTITLPVALGFDATRRMLSRVNGASALLLAGACALGWLPPAAYAVSLLAVYNWLFLQVARDEDSDLGFTCDVVVDGLFYAAGLLAWIGTALPGA